MFQRTTTIMIALALSTLLFPVGTGEEIVEQEYAAALGVREGVTGEHLGLGFVLFPNQEGGCHYWCVPRPVGGVNLWPDLPYDHLVLQFDDAAFGQPPNQVCLYDRADGVCDDDHSTGTACGERSVADVPAELGVAVLIYSVAVLPSLEVCLGSTGTVTATFSVRGP